MHRDLKPANITVGYGSTKKENTIYLIDYGLTKKETDANIQTHTTTGHINSSFQKMAGTPHFAAINAHAGNGSCFKKDDL